MCLKEMQGHDEKILALEKERASLANELKNIASSPDLAQDYGQLKEMRAKLAYQERVFCEKEKKVSSKVKNSLQEKVQEMKRATAELIKEVDRSETLEKSGLVYNEIKNTRKQEVMQGQNFVSSFKAAIGCYDSSSYALENDLVLTVATLQKAFKAGVEESLPAWEDAMSRAFSYTGKFESCIKISSYPRTSQRRD